MAGDLEMTNEASVELMKFLSQVASRLGVGKHVYVVGGAVRNFVIDRPIKDIDVVIDSVALGGKDSGWFASELVKEIPTRTSLQTNNYGVALLHIVGDWFLGGENLKGEDIEIANARKESYGGEAGKGYKPHMVEPATIEEDVYRREFTFNTLLWKLHDLAQGPDKAEILDLTGCGLRDLQEGMARCPRDPDVVFSDDPSRMVRAVKFLLKYGLQISPEVKASIRKNRQKIKQIPSSHLSNMLINTFLRDSTGKRALEELDALGILDVVREIAQTDKSFREALAGWADKEAKVDFLFVLMDMGLPGGKRLSFLTPAQQVRVRESTTRMTHSEAEEFIRLLNQPGKVLDTRGLMAEFPHLKGAAMQQVQALARAKMLEQPALAWSTSRLTEEVRKGLQRVSKVARFDAKIEGLDGLLRGEPTVLYHGTTAQFRKFDISKSQDDLVNQFYGRGIFLTPSKRVAWKYAEANRNIAFPPSIVQDLRKVDADAGDFLALLVRHGNDAWEMERTSGQTWAQAFADDVVRTDLNLVDGIAGYVLGSKVQPVGFDTGGLFSQSTGLPEWMYDDLDRVGLDSSKYRPKVYTVVVTVDNVLVTARRAEAKTASRKGYDCVVYHGPGIVDGVPEVAVFDPSKVRVQSVMKSSATVPSECRYASPGLPVFSALPYLSRTTHRGVSAECDHVQDIIQALKDGDAGAAKHCAHILSKHPGLRGFRGVVVPAPRSSAKKAPLTAFARALVREGVGSRVAVAVVREEPVESSRMRRRKGLPGVDPAEHERSMGLGGDVVLPDEPVLIVDDIFTTGGTIKAAAATLRKSGHSGLILGATAGYFESDVTKGCRPVSRKVMASSALATEYYQSLKDLRDQVAYNKARYLENTTELWLKWFSFYAKARKWSEYVIDKLALPPKSAKAVEMAARLFSKVYPRGKGPPDIIKWFELNEARFTLLDQARTWPERSESSGIFTVGPFTVHDTVQSSPKDLAVAEAIIERAVKDVRGSGVPGLAQMASGVLYLVGQIGRKNWAAWYMPTKEAIYLRPGVRGSSVSESARHLVHEIGHRYWKAKLNAAQKGAWERHHNRMSESKPEYRTLDVGEVLVPLVNNKRVRVDEYKHGKAVLADVATGGVVGEVNLLTLAEWVRDADSKMQFPTLYAVKDAEEHFCESLSLYCQGLLKGSNLKAFEALILGKANDVSMRLGRTLVSSSLARKGPRYNTSFYGSDDGSWEPVTGVVLGFRKQGYDWEAVPSMSSKNEWRNLSVEGATEHHRGFREALREMVRKYPEILEFWIQFDGPFIPVSQLVTGVSTPPQKSYPWKQTVFYHGTSAWAWDRIQLKGLQPRAVTNVDPAYGSVSGAHEGRRDAVYLTTQLQMAHMAARDAARKTRSTPVILKVVQLDGEHVAADEDSGETDPVKSLGRLGSVAYVGPISPRQISLFEVADDQGGWQKTGGRKAFSESMSRVSTRFMERHARRCVVGESDEH
jgi:tRNA nucleotidyltransferase/poly(A) polymerase